MVNLGQRPSVWWVLIIAVLTLVIFFFIVDYTTLLAVNNGFTDLQDSILITCNEFSTFQFYGTPPTTYNDFSKPTFAWQLSVCFGVTLSNCNDPGKYSPPGAQGLNYISVMHDDIPTNWVMNFSLNSISYVAISGTFWKWRTSSLMLCRFGSWFQRMLVGANGWWYGIAATNSWRRLECRQWMPMFLPSFETPLAPAFTRLAPMRATSCMNWPVDWFTKVVHFWSSTMVIRCRGWGVPCRRSRDMNLRTRLKIPEHRI